MKIVIGATPDSWIKALTDGLTESGMEVLRYSNMEDLPKNGKVLMLYSKPEYSIEASITRGEDTQPVIESWIAEAQEFLKLFRHNRQRVLLLHGPDILMQPESFSSFCQKELNVTVSADKINQINMPPSDREIFRVLAAQAVTGSLELKDLAGELEASAHTLRTDPTRYTPDWVSACNEVRGSDNSRPSKELVEENELLLLQLHQVQEELESYYLEAKALREKQGNASTADVEDLLSYAIKLEHEYTKLLKSHTWKAMAPVRHLGRIVKGILRGKKVPRNCLPKRPRVLSNEPVGGRKGRRTRV
jgi:hypothetical protein